MLEDYALHLRDVVFRFNEKGKRNILDHTDLDIKAGTMTVIMGSSGCGKSTLAAAIAGLYPENGGYLEKGEILLFGNSTAALDPQTRAACLTMMFQNPDLQFCMDTLRKEMIFCMENICIPVNEIDGRISAAVQELGITDLLDRQMLTLSGGEKQKAALACLYVMQSKCILLDECFANIDRSSAEEIMGIIRKIHAGGTTIIAIDHQADLWLNDADEIIILGSGARVIARGITKDNLQDHAAIFEQEGLFFPKTVKRAAKDCISAEAALSFKNLSVRKGTLEKRLFRKQPDTRPFLLENADAEFPKGYMTAVLGPSGTGKTTAFLSVLKQHPYDGMITLYGTDIASIKPADLYKQIGIVFQNPANQFITQNVKEEVIAGLRVWHKNLSDRECEERALEMLESYGLKAQQRYSPYMLSQGQQRRLAVLSVLTGGQKLLLLDEPTYGQDYRSAMAIMTQLRQKMIEEGLTVIFITHDRNLAETYADKIYEISDRKLIERSVTDGGCSK